MVLYTQMELNVKKTIELLLKDLVLIHFRTKSNDHENLKEQIEWLPHVT